MLLDIEIGPNLLPFCTTPLKSYYIRIALGMKKTKKTGHTKVDMNSFVFTPKHQNQKTFCCICGPKRHRLLDLWTNLGYYMQFVFMWSALARQKQAIYIYR